MWNYRLKFGRQEVSRLSDWKEAVERGERVPLTVEQVKEQAEYRKKMLAQGRRPKSYEMRVSEDSALKRNLAARRKIEKIRLIAEIARKVQR